MPVLAIAALLAVPVGVMLGLLGGGGSILLLPALVYGLRLPEKEAIATSLMVIMLTSLAAGAQHALRGGVRWRTAAVFAPSTMIGAYSGGAVAQFIPGSVLIVLFALLMLVTAAGMWAGRRPEPGSTPKGRRPVRVLRITVIGLVVGCATGLVGAGGGFLIVPALVILSRVPMREAVATSLVIISANSLAGFLGYVGHVTIDITLALTVSASAMAGSFLGALACTMVPQARLRRGFAVFVAVMGLAILAREVPSHLHAGMAQSKEKAYASMVPPDPRRMATGT